MRISIGIVNILGIVLSGGRATARDYVNEDVQTSQQ